MRPIGRVAAGGRSPLRPSGPGRQTGLLFMTKSEMRDRLRQARKAHVAALPQAIHGLLFRQPPAPLLRLIPEGAIIGLYRATPDEAPASRYAAHFHEAGHTIALPRFSSRSAGMQFAVHSDPFGEADLEPGPFGISQPEQDAAAVTPDVLFVPMVGFTADGQRLGQGGGHYDRWLSSHPGTVAIGLAWDCQLCDTLPVEPHDVPLRAVVTPTRLYGAE